MQTVYLCYKMNQKTGLSEVTEVSQIEDFAKQFLESKLAHRVEQFNIDGHKNGKALIKTYFSLEDFHMKIKIDQIYGLIDTILMNKLMTPAEKDLEELIFDKIGDESLKITLLNGEIYYITKEGEVTLNGA